MSTSHPGMLGTVLKRFRLAAALSQEELAERSTVSVRAISDIERGQRTTARFETVRLLAGALDLSEPDRALFMAAALPNVKPASPSAVPDQTRAGSALRLQALPAQPTPLIGREAVLAGIVETIERNPGRAITLTGSGGVGKTRLAIEAARRAAASFDDGVAFASLAPLSDPASVTVAIAQSLGIATTSSSLPDSISDFLQGRCVLLVLDNFEHLIEAAPLISQLVTIAPGLSVLVTSRVRLRLSTELELPVPSLDLPAASDPVEALHDNEAVRMFVARARATDPGFDLTAENAGAVVSLCHRLAGLPLAIELIASRLKVLPLDALVKRLDHPLPLLTGGSRDMPPRQQSMRNSIAWSYGLLSPAEQHLFRSMAVFAGGMSLAAAEAIDTAAGIDPQTTLETLSGLAESGLIQRASGYDSEPRFQMLEPVREYGVELLAAMGELEAARLHHAMHFLAFASADAPLPDEPASDDWIRKLAIEYNNLVLAFDHLCQPETRDLALSFAVALGPYWWQQGLFPDGWPRMRKTIAFIDPEPSQIRAQALSWGSGLAIDAGNLDQATTLAQQALEDARACDDRHAEAAAIQFLAWKEELQEHWDAASELFEQALAMWRELDNPYMQGQALMLLGGQAYVQGDYALARAREEEAERLFTITGGTTWQAATQWYLGFIAVADGRIADAARHYDRSLRLWLSIDQRSHWFKPLVHLADIAAEYGSFEAAARLLGAADKLLYDTGARRFPFDEPAYERAVTRGRATLGEVGYEASYAAGRTSTVDDWLAEAEAIVGIAEAGAATSPSAL